MPFKHREITLPYVSQRYSHYISITSWTRCTQYALISSLHWAMFWLNSRYFYCRVHYTVLLYPSTPSYWYYSLRTHTHTHIRSITTHSHTTRIVLHRTLVYIAPHPYTAVCNTGIHTYLATHASILTTLTTCYLSACVVPLGFNTCQCTLRYHLPLATIFLSLRWWYTWSVSLYTVTYSITSLDRFGWYTCYPLVLLPIDYSTNSVLNPARSHIH